LQQGTHRIALYDLLRHRRMIRSPPRLPGRLNRPLCRLATSRLSPASPTTSAAPCATAQSKPVERLSSITTRSPASRSDFRYTRRCRSPKPSSWGALRSFGVARCALGNIQPEANCCRQKSIASIATGERKWRSPQTGILQNINSAEISRQCALLHPSRVRRQRVSKCTMLMRLRSGEAVNSLLPQSPAHRKRGATDF
jgi:hypothetical protein